MITHIKPTIKIVLLFTLLGPAIGGLLYTALLFILGHGQLSFSSAEGVLIFIFFYSYLIGVVPAFITALIVGSFHGEITPKRWIAASSVIGFCVATAFSVLITHASLTESSLLIFGLPGLIASVICAWACVFKIQRSSF